MNKRNQLVAAAVFAALLAVPAIPSYAIDKESPSPTVVKFTALDQQTAQPDRNFPVAMYPDANGFHIRGLVMPAQWTLSIPELGVKDMVLADKMTVSWDFAIPSFAGPGWGTVELQSEGKTVFWGAVSGGRTQEIVGNDVLYDNTFSIVGEFYGGPLKGVVLRGETSFIVGENMEGFYSCTWNGTAIVPKDVLEALKHAAKKH